MLSPPSRSNKPRLHLPRSLHGILNRVRHRRRLLHRTLKLIRIHPLRYRWRLEASMLDLFLFFLLVSVDLDADCDTDDDGYHHDDGDDYDFQEEFEETHCGELAQT